RLGCAAPPCGSQRPAVANEQGYQVNLHARSGKGFGVLAVFASLPAAMSEMTPITSSVCGRGLSPRPTFSQVSAGSRLSQLIFRRRLPAPH
ncbi:hypothetical protein, partial [Mesorhizobium sp.]|uniref:hypothetical protein n=1 Tax=Mesorhizobium sp. TaxID=1871066 RepID=UPI0025D37138